MTNPADTYATGIRLWQQWTEMWNERPALARELVADSFVLHLIQPSGIDATTVTTPAAVEAWVIAHCAKFERLKFILSIGPFVDTQVGVVAGPWHAELTQDGVARFACGMDTIAFRDGKITEYWTMSKPADDIGRWSTHVTRR